LVTFHGNDLLWVFGNNITDYEKEEFARFLIRGEIGPIPANESRKKIRSGSATGRLLGGNLGCLLKLVGTPYWPDFNGVLLFVEAYEISPKACVSEFHLVLTKSQNYS
jgi:muramoyltetrapeptide carboxypeptidase